MNKLLILLLLSSTTIASRGQSSIYDFKLDSMNSRSIIDFSAFKGKKILIINTASSDTLKYLYGQIKELNKRYKDSLVIVVLPSNSFNSENREDAAMYDFYSQDSDNRFPVSQKISVRAVGKHPLYEWLTQKTQNGMANSDVIRPFQKYLVDKDGKLIGIFSARISLFDPVLLEAIVSNNH